MTDGYYNTISQKRTGILFVLFGEQVYYSFSFEIWRYISQLASELILMVFKAMFGLLKEKGKTIHCLHIVVKGMARMPCLDL